jgi:hypothetical protein
MGLTRIRAQQISDIDYKQSVRVITLTNITLSGGAPATVDGVSLIAGDRILVNGQSNAAQNGLYQVQTVGTGSNGAWVRTSDANQDGEIQPGMVVMVTQGTEYADTPWKLVTNGVIIIDTTELVFEENYSLAFGNVYANGTAVIAAAVSAPLTLEAGNNISIVGNNVSKSVTIAVTGISLTSVANGTSNVDIAIADGNVTTTVNGNTTLTITDTGANVTGYVTATGNIDGANLTTAGAVDATGNVTGGNIATTGRASIDDLTITGNVTGDLVPSANVTYDLGQNDARWNDLWLANSTIYIGNAQISANATSLTLTNPDGTSFEPAGNFANLTVFTRGSGNVNFGLNFGALEVVGRAGNISIPLAA